MPSLLSFNANVYPNGRALLFVLVLLHIEVLLEKF